MMGKPVQESSITDHLLYVVGITPDENPHLLLQLENFGYSVQVFANVIALTAAIQVKLPSMLVVNMGLQFEVAELSALQATLPIKIPTLFLANDSRFHHRLVAANADADGYFVKPIDMVAMNARIESLLRREEKIPYSILVIDDDKYITDFYSVILRSAGMEVHVLHDPTEIFNALAEYRPELLLMDVYMPICSGLTLAKIIRQESMYLDVPIVFLSTENNLGKQIDAIQSGGDDFLTKPMPAGYLISSLTNRVERYRGLRELIVRDSLTKLYNHSSLVDRASVEIERAKRHGKPLAFAMIDLDYFKNVNDNYGHLVGDNVIRSLAQLLQKSLRRLDVIGRYGGEEFGVIFPETTALAASQAIDKVRQTFAKIKHHSTDHRWYFEVTFSAGVVELGAQADASTLFDHADKALYSAKSGGRNRVKRD
jgi:diguanylate cyclase (GGDEF)-like protein